MIKIQLERKNFSLSHNSRINGHYRSIFTIGLDIYNLNTMQKKKFMKISIFKEGLPSLTISDYFDRNEAPLKVKGAKNFSEVTKFW